MYYLRVVGVRMIKKKTMYVRFLLALYLGKVVKLIIRMIYDKEGGTHFPGKLAIKVCPNFLSLIGRPKTIIAVTGTNGKTSVANFINHILKANGLTTVINDKGSNMPYGIASSLLEVSNLLGKVKSEVAVLEVDERISGFVYDHLPPTYLICTNLFRDSIKRNGHSEFILTKIKGSIPKTTTLILNADDLISCNIGRKENKKVYFAVGPLPFEKPFNNIVRDIRVCPLCKHKLEYLYYHYHHIGKAFCPKCHFKSPEADFQVSEVDYKKRIFILNEGNKIIKYKLIDDSIFNIYNMISTIAVLRTFGLSHQQIKKPFEQLTLKKDRLKNELINNIEVITMLAKDQNPISCSRMFDYVRSQSGNKVVILYVTDSLDKVHGSEDISWLYDTDFEYLNDPTIKQIVIGGTRCYDVALRLKMAFIDEDKLVTNQRYQDVDLLISLSKIDKIFILYALYAYPLAFKLKNKIKERIINND